MLTPEEVQRVVKLIGYEDKARKFTVYHLLQYWCMAALEQWGSYRSSVDYAALCGLPVVHYSRFSTKAAEVPFSVFKELFHILALRSENGQPLQVVETLGSKHDGPMSEALAQPDYILVMDCAYGKLERLDHFKTHGQSFVIRLRDNVHLEKPHALRRLTKSDSSVIRDITCQLGTPQCRSRQCHRVVMFRDFEGREIRVVTDLMQVTAEQIAQIYKARWQIEVFFRWIKQHLNIPTLFGTTENAVYGQLFCALIVYVLLNWLFIAAQTSWPQHAVLSFARFSRLFLLQNYLLNG